MAEVTTGEAQQEAPPPPFSARRFFGIWLALGIQSFGGGVATLALIRRAAVDQYGWMSEADFIRDWALVQMAPGINLLGLVVLIGRRVAGARGIAIALVGLLLPSGLTTAVLTALYAKIAGVHAVEAALRGIVPATVALGMLTSWQMARPLLQDSRREGTSSLMVSLILLAATAAIYAVWSNVPVLAFLFGAGGIAALYRWKAHARPIPIQEHGAPASEETE